MTSPKPSKPSLIDEQLIAKNIINRYPHLCTVYPAAFATFKRHGGLIREDYKRACHAPLRNEWSSYIDTILTAYHSNLSADVADKFMDFIINRLFRNFSDRVEVKTLDGKKYIKINDVQSWSFPAVYNFCIATRFILEYAKNVIAWDKLVEAGIDPALSFIMCCSADFNRGSYTYGPLYSSPDIKISTNSYMTVASHCPIDRNSKWEAILEGCPENLPHTLSGINRICWGWREDNFAGFHGKSIREIQDFFINEGLING